MFIDGDHSLDVPLLDHDIQSIREISHSNTLIFMDEVRCAEDSYWCKHPTDAWVKSIYQGTITEHVSVQLIFDVGFAWVISSSAKIV